MDFKQDSHRIYLEGQEGKLIAEVTFPAVSESIVNINHTFVDDSLRGQGIAGKLMEEVVKWLQAENKKTYLTCSYAVMWFGKNKQYSDLVASKE